MKKLAILSLALWSVVLTIHSAMASRTDVGGVVVPTLTPYVLALLALFVLFTAFLLYRKRSDIFRLIGPMFLR